MESNENSQPNIPRVPARPKRNNKNSETSLNSIQTVDSKLDDKTEGILNNESKHEIPIPIPNPDQKSNLDTVDILSVKDDFEIQKSREDIDNTNDKEKNINIINDQSNLNSIEKSQTTQGYEGMEHIGDLMTQSEQIKSNEYLSALTSEDSSVYSNFSNTEQFKNNSNEEIENKILSDSLKDKSQTSQEILNDSKKVADQVASELSAYDSIAKNGNSKESKINEDYNTNTNTTKYKSSTPDNNLDAISIKSDISATASTTSIPAIPPRPRHHKNHHHHHHLNTIEQSKGKEEKLEEKQEFGLAGSDTILKYTDEVEDKVFKDKLIALEEEQKNEKNKNKNKMANRSLSTMSDMDSFDYENASLSTPGNYNGTDTEYEYKYDGKQDNAEKRVEAEEELTAKVIADYESEKNEKTKKVFDPTVDSSLKSAKKEQELFPKVPPRPRSRLNEIHKHSETSSLMGSGSMDSLATNDSNLSKLDKISNTVNLQNEDKGLHSEAENVKEKPETETKTEKKTKTEPKKEIEKETEKEIEKETGKEIKKDTEKETGKEIKKDTEIQTKLEAEANTIKMVRTKTNEEEDKKKSKPTVPPKKLGVGKSKFTGVRAAFAANLEAVMKRNATVGGSVRSNSTNKIDGKLNQDGTADESKSDMGEKVDGKLKEKGINTKDENSEGSGFGGDAKIGDNHTVTTTNTNTNNSGATSGLSTGRRRRGPARRLPQGATEKVGVFDISGVNIVWEFTKGNRTSV